MIRYAFILFMLMTLPSTGRDSLTVDASRLAGAVPALGTNLNYLVDAPLTAGQLAPLGATVLRYPGGEKSDTNLWSVPPFERPSPQIARLGPNQWPGGDRALVLADGTFVQPPLDFDQFLALAQAIGADPLVVVPFDSAFAPAESGGTAPSYDELKATAVAWVRYAAGRVRYWEIGNESYQGSYNGAPTAAQYAAGVKDFAQAMKAVDPSIQIGANGGSSSWWSTVLGQAGSSIDFLSVHNYPLWATASYTKYRDSTASLVSDIARARSAAGGRPLLITESGALTHSSYAPTPDLGHAIMLADILMAQAAAPGVTHNLSWTSRWVSIASGARSYDLLDRAGSLTPSGQAQALLAPAMRGRVTYSTGTSKVHVLATKDGGVLRIVLLNKDTIARDIALTIKGLGSATATRVQFGGGNPADKLPAVVGRGVVTFSSGRANLSLASVSLTVLTFQ